MFLSHLDIEKLIDEKQITVIPEFDKKNIKVAGLRVHLAKDILVPEPGQEVSLTEQKVLKYKEVDLSKEDFFLNPGDFILAATYEQIQTPKNILMLLDGRSTVARLGLTTHVTASVSDGTFEEPHASTLEIKNLGNFKIRLRFKDPIAMVIFCELKTPITKKLQTQYTAQMDKVMPPNLLFRTGVDQ